MTDLVYRVKLGKLWLCSPDFEEPDSACVSVKDPAIYPDIWGLTDCVFGKEEAFRIAKMFGGEVYEVTVKQTMKRIFK